MGDPYRDRLLLATWMTVDSLAELRRVDAEYRWLESQAAKASAHDRISGTVLDLANLLEDSDQSGEVATAIWIVDGSRCWNCFGYLGPWVRLKAFDEIATKVLVVGGPLTEAYGVFRTLGSDVQIRADRGVVDDLLGPIPPSTKILVDSRGTVLVFDGQQSRASCDGAFERIAEAVVMGPRNLNSASVR